MYRLKNKILPGVFFVLFVPVMASATKIPINNNADSKNNSLSVSKRPGDLTQINRVLIDVRDSKDYDLFHIDNTLNIKPHQISTKSYFKNKKLVLIGNAYNETSLNQRCEQLKEAGFSSVSVLPGGIQALVKKDKLKINGTDIEQSLYYLAPQNMLDIAKPEQYLVINITGRNDTRLKLYFPAVVTTSIHVHKKSHVRVLKRMIEGKPEFSAVLIVGENNLQYSLLNQINQDQLQKTIFFLKGGLTGLGMFEENIKAILGKREFTLGNIKGCTY